MKGPYKQSPSTAMLTLKNNYAPQFSGLEIDIDRSKQNLQIKNIVIRSSNYPSLGRDEAIIKIEGHHWKLNTFRNKELSKNILNLSDLVTKLIQAKVPTNSWQTEALKAFKENIN